jgi:hypothetical protein
LNWLLELSDSYSISIYFNLFNPNSYYFFINWIFPFFPINFNYNYNTIVSKYSILSYYCEIISSLSRHSPLLQMNCNSYSQIYCCLLGLIEPINTFSISLSILFAAESSLNLVSVNYVLSLSLVNDSIFKALDELSWCCFENTKWPGEGDLKCFPMF